MYEIKIGVLSFVDNWVNFISDYILILIPVSFFIVLLIENIYIEKEGEE